MGYSILPSENLCYPGTAVLINKLGLRSQEALNRAESVAVALRATQLLELDNKEPFSFSFYCSLHKALFGDIYEWAGTLRTVDLAKKGTNFYPALQISELGEAKFRYLNEQKNFCSLNGTKYIHAIAEFYHELNMLHPFREGNGRTQRVFFTMLLKKKGCYIDFSKCDTDQLMVATIYAAHGVLEYLESFFSEYVKGIERA